MGRPVTLFTGQWADLPLEDLAGQASGWGFDGLELACWGDHFEVDRALADGELLPPASGRAGAQRPQRASRSAHTSSARRSATRSTQRHQAILPPEVWGDGDPGGRAGARGRADEGHRTRGGALRRDAGQRLHGLPGLAPALLVPAERLRGRSSAPTSSSRSAGARSSTCSTPRASASGSRCTRPRSPTTSSPLARRSTRSAAARPSASTSIPSHFAHQFLDPAAVRARVRRPDLPRPCQGLDQRRLDGRRSILGSHLTSASEARGWDFVSPGQGDVDFEALLPGAQPDRLSRARSRSSGRTRGMDREYGAQDALAFVRRTDFAPSERRIRRGDATIMTEAAQPFDAVRLDALLDEAGIDVVVATSPHNVRYLLGSYSLFHEAFDAIGVDRYLPAVCIPLGNAAAAFAVGADIDAGQHEVERPWIPTLIDASQTATETARLIARELRARGLEHATVALELSFAPHRLVSELSTGLPALRLVEAAAVLEELRAVKRPAELELLREAAEAIVGSMVATARALPGATTAELADRLGAEEALRGLRFDYCLVAAGPSFNRSPSSQRWLVGDVLSLDSGGRRHGYIGDLCRMAVNGEPTSELVDLLAEVRAVQDAARGPVSAGAPGAAIYAAAAEATGALPHGDAMAFVAHGMGLVPHEGLVSPARADPVRADAPRSKAGTGNGALDRDRIARAGDRPAEARGHGRRARRRMGGLRRHETQPIVARGLNQPLPPGRCRTARRAATRLTAAPSLGQGRLGICFEASCEAVDLVPFDDGDAELAEQRVRRFDLDAAGSRQRGAHERVVQEPAEPGGHLVANMQAGHLGEHVLVELRRPRRSRSPSRAARRRSARRGCAPSSLRARSSRLRTTFRRTGRSRGSRGRTSQGPRGSPRGGRENAARGRSPGSRCSCTSSSSRRCSEPARKRIWSRWPRARCRSESTASDRMDDHWQVDLCRDCAEHVGHDLGVIVRRPRLRRHPGRRSPGRRTGRRRPGQPASFATSILPAVVTSSAPASTGARPATSSRVISTTRRFSSRLR